jgi:hypothetical protein
LALLAELAEVEQLANGHAPPREKDFVVGELGLGPGVLLVSPSTPLAPCPVIPVISM